MPEKAQLKNGEYDDTERTRREVLRLLESILKQVTVPPPGPRPLDPPAQEAVKLFARLEQCLNLTPGSIITSA